MRMDYLHRLIEPLRACVGGLHFSNKTSKSVRMESVHFHNDRAKNASVEPTNCTIGVCGFRLCREFSAAPRISLTTQRLMT